MLLKKPKVYAIELSPAARKALKKMDSHIVRPIFEKIKQLASSSENRVIYEPLEKEIIIYIVYVGHRKSVYKDLIQLK